jgi:hypothetical protein
LDEKKAVVLGYLMERPMDNVVVGVKAASLEPFAVA